jgi:hypothetical protein
MLLEKGEPNVVGEYKATGEEGGAKYAKVETKKKVDKAKLEKGLADLERKSAMKKRIKKQAEGAVADAKAIKAPEMKKELSTLPPKKTEDMGKYEKTIEKYRKILYSIKSFDELEKLKQSDDYTSFKKLMKTEKDVLLKKKYTGKVKELLTSFQTLDELETQLSGVYRGSGDWGTFKNKETGKLEHRQQNPPTFENAELITKQMREKQGKGAVADAKAIKAPEMKMEKTKKKTAFKWDKVAPQLNGKEVAYDGAFGTSTKPFIFDMKKIMVDALKRIKEKNINIKVKRIQTKIDNKTIYNYAIPTDQEIFVWKGKPLFSYDKREDGLTFLILLDHKGKPIVPIAVNYRTSQAPHRPYDDDKRPSERLASDITLGQESGTGMNEVNIKESKPFLEPHKLTDEEIKQYGEKDKKGELSYHKFF